MEQNLIYIFIAVGLSMDAFSLALAYGMNEISTKRSILLSIIVGIFHFLMPKLGSIIGITFFESFISKANIIVAIVFIILAIEMFLSRNEEEKENLTNLISMIVFAFTVSIDSFSVGIALSLTEKSLNSAYIIFALVSATFTLSGLILGKKISEKFGHKATYLGIMILIALAIKYLI